MAKKPETLHESRTIVYGDKHWSHLASLRERAMDIMQTLESSGIHSFVYGSIARGDVGKSSDVDIIVPYPVSSYKLEISAGRGVRRELVQATPSMVLKGHIVLDDRTTVTFPLFKLRPREEEFYSWGGRADISQLEAEIRVPGVDKRLVLIRPTPEGHTEHGVIGYEPDVAKAVGVSIETAKERVRVLTRRDRLGRTGVYLTRVLEEDDSFEAVAKSLRDSDPALRRTVEKRERSR